MHALIAEKRMIRSSREPMMTAIVKIAVAWTRLEMCRSEDSVWLRKGDGETILQMKGGMYSVQKWNNDTVSRKNRQSSRSLVENQLKEEMVEQRRFAFYRVLKHYQKRKEQVDSFDVVGVLQSWLFDLDQAGTTIVCQALLTL